MKVLLNVEILDVNNTLKIDLFRCKCTLISHTGNFIQILQQRII